MVQFHKSAECVSKKICFFSFLSQHVQSTRSVSVNFSALQIRFSALDDERVSAEEENTVSVSRRRLKLREPASLQAVRPALQCYVEAANSIPASKQ